MTIGGTSAVQWLGLSASTAGDTGSIPGQGTKIPQAACMAKKKKRTIAAPFIITPNWK